MRASARAKGELQLSISEQQRGLKGRERTTTPAPSPANRQPALVLGDISTLHVRADVDEQNAMEVASDLDATFSLKSDSSKKFKVQFVRIEPYVIPKVSLTGASTERVDTRVLQVIYKLEKPKDQPLYVGQQVDVFIARKK